MSWQSRVPKSDTRPEKQLDQMLQELGYTPIKIYQRKGLPVKHDTIKALYPDTVVSGVIEYITVVPGGGDPLLTKQLIKKVVLMNGGHWHDHTQAQQRDDKMKYQLYVEAGFWVVAVSDYWFKSKAKKAELKPLLDAAMKSSKKVEDYLAT